MVSSLAIVSVLDTANAVKQRRSSARALTSLSYFLQFFSELLPREVLCDIFLCRLEVRVETEGAFS